MHTHTHYTHVLAKTHSIYCCDNVPGIAVARVAAAVVALVTTVAVAVAINV